MITRSGRSLVPTRQRRARPESMTAPLFAHHQAARQTSPSPAAPVPGRAGARGAAAAMTAVAQHASPHPIEDAHAVRVHLRTAEFSDDAKVLDELPRAGVTCEVLRKIAHNPATSEGTLAHLMRLPREQVKMSPIRAAVPMDTSGAPRTAPSSGHGPLKIPRHGPLKPTAPPRATRGSSRTRT